MQPSESRKQNSTSVFRMPRRARIRNRIADIAEATGVHHQPLESEPEARMRHRAVAAQVAIPAVMRRIEVEFPDARVEQVQALLALAAAHDLADAGREDV